MAVKHQSSYAMAAAIGSQLSLTALAKAGSKFASLVKVSKAITAGLDAVDIIGAVGLVIDLVDPYSYGSTLSRGSVDLISKSAALSWEAVYKDPDTLKQLQDNLNAAYPRVSQEDKNVLLAKRQAIYNEFFLEPYAVQRCFENMVTYSSDDGPSASGPPLPDCNPTYLKAYTEYSEANRAQYLAQGIKTRDRIIASTNAINKTLTEHKVKNKQQEYLIPIYALSGIVGVILVAILVMYGVMRNVAKKF